LKSIAALRPSSESSNSTRTRPKRRALAHTPFVVANNSEDEGADRATQNNSAGGWGAPPSARFRIPWCEGIGAAGRNGESREAVECVERVPRFAPALAERGRRRPASRATTRRPRSSLARAEAIATGDFTTRRSRRPVIAAKAQGRGGRAARRESPGNRSGTRSGRELVPGRFKTRPKRSVPCRHEIRVIRIRSRTGEEKVACVASGTIGDQDHGPRNKISSQLL